MWIYIFSCIKQYVINVSYYIAWEEIPFKDFLNIFILISFYDFSRSFSAPLTQYNSNKKMKIKSEQTKASNLFGKYLIFVYWL